jgi:catechol 2,3-dioxygenase-like lactoylglutathione lyase family enzyme
MQILEFAFVCYAVTDLALARDFYEKVLGFTPAKKWLDGDKGWIEYEVGPHTLAITNMAEGEDWKPTPGSPGVALEVADFDAAIAELKAAKVKFALEPCDTPVCRMAMICDPDGSRICIHKRNAVKLPNVK